MELVRHETCRQYVVRRLSEGWRIINQRGFEVVLQSPDGIIRPVDLRNDIETLRPNANGDHIGLDTSDSATNWQNVDEETPNEDTDYNWLNGPLGGNQEYDLYELGNHVSGSGTINSVRVYVRAKSETSSNAELTIGVKTGGVEHDGTPQELSTSWVTYNELWNQNPETSAAWGSDWTVIDNLQAKCYLDTPSYQDSYVTQAYAEIDYTSPAAGLENKSANMAAKMIAGKLI